MGFIAIFVLAVSAGAFYYYQTRRSCISYYDKDGVNLLYQECE